MTLTKKPLHVGKGDEAISKGKKKTSTGIKTPKTAGGERNSQLGCKKEGAQVSSTGGEESNRPLERVRVSVAFVRKKRGRGNVDMSAVPGEPGGEGRLTRRREKRGIGGKEDISSMKGGEGGRVARKGWSPAQPLKKVLTERQMERVREDL